MGGDEDPDDDADALYPLTQAETEILRQLENHLVRHLDRENDPKFDRVRQVLEERFEGRSWLERGVLIFSQFYDSASALCEYLAKYSSP
jgi:ERCC4-related helicase